MIEIPVYDPRPEYRQLKAEIDAAIQNVLDTGRFIMGSEVTGFEEEAADYLGVRYAIGLNSGTDALVIGLQAMGIEPGDEVITTAYSFFATAEAISILGAVPVFVDIDPETFNMDVAGIEGKITRKTKAIIPVHLYGHAADMDAISEIATRHHLLVLEDVAQAFGGAWRGHKLGTIGDLGAFSFFPTKNLGAYGDAGLLATNDEALANTARMLRAHGASKKYHNEMVGYNSRLDALQAAILRVKLKNIEDSNRKRREAAERYTQMLTRVEAIVTPTEVDGATHVYHQYTLRILDGKRDAVKNSLAEKGIGSMIYYPVPLHRLPIYQGLDLRLEHAEQAATEVLSIPIWPQIEVETQRKVADALIEAIG